MIQTSIHNADVLQFQTVAKNFIESGFQPQGFVVLGHDAQLRLEVFRSVELPASLDSLHDVALPLSTAARPAHVVRFFQRPDVRLLLGRLHAGHKLAWNGKRHVGVLDNAGQHALQGLQGLLDSFNQQADIAAIV